MLCEFIEIIFIVAWVGVNFFCLFGLLKLVGKLRVSALAGWLAATERGCPVDEVHSATHQSGRHASCTHVVVVVGWGRNNLQLGNRV